MKRSEFRGHNLIAVRVYFRDDSGEMHPTKKGVSVKLDRLPELVDALTLALDDARRNGLLQPAEVAA